MTAVTAFTTALMAPERSFATLADAVVRYDQNGLPAVRRTTYRVECEIEWHGASYLLSMPLSTAAAHRGERLFAALQHRNHPALAVHRLLRNELLTADEVWQRDLLLQELTGEPLREAVPFCSAEELAHAMQTLKADLRTLGIAHRNLQLKNLRWADGRLIPIRYYDAAFSTDHATDDEALDRLYEELATLTDAHHRELHALPLASTTLLGHRWVGNEFEGLICVEDESGYGYVDPTNRVVIPATYRWADDFHEGRAVVETASGMGLIDREGHYILPPLYEEVNYRYEQSLVQVRQGGLWAQFDYLGRQLTPFGTQYEV